MRKKIPDSVQAEVLLQSRRRCCACYGLNRDESEKKGQIAHLDQNPANNKLDNLVFLCLNHHDQYDSKTSQSKGLIRTELERYRDELLYRFSSWAARVKRDELLNFIASQIGLDQLVDAAIKVAGGVVWYGEELAFDVLITDEVDYCDGDLYVPHLVVLDHFASWGWVKYIEEERAIEEDTSRVFITVQRERVCDDVASRLLARVKGQENKHERIMQIALSRGWKVNLADDVPHIAAADRANRAPAEQKR